MTWTHWKLLRRAETRGPILRPGTLALALAIGVPAICPREPGAQAPPTALEQPPGYGISGYFALDGGHAGIAIRPGRPGRAPALDAGLSGDRIRIASRQASGGTVDVRLIDARGRVAWAWNGALPAGGEILLRAPDIERGIYVLAVEGGKLGRAAALVPFLGPGAGPFP